MLLARQKELVTEEVWNIGSSDQRQCYANRVQPLGDHILLGTTRINNDGPHGLPGSYERGIEVVHVPTGATVLRDTYGYRGVADFHPQTDTRFLTSFSPSCKDSCGYSNRLVISAYDAGSEDLEWRRREPDPIDRFQKRTHLVAFPDNVFFLMAGYDNITQITQIDAQGNTVNVTESSDGHLTAAFPYMGRVLMIKESKYRIRRNLPKLYFGQVHDPATCSEHKADGLGELEGEIVSFEQGGRQVPPSMFTLDDHLVVFHPNKGVGLYAGPELEKVAAAGTHFSFGFPDPANSYLEEGVLVMGTRDYRGNSGVVVMDAATMTDEHHLAFAVRDLISVQIIDGNIVTNNTHSASSTYGINVWGSPTEVLKKLKSDPDSLEPIRHHHMRDVAGILRMGEETFFAMGEYDNFCRKPKVKSLRVLKEGRL